MTRVLAQAPLAMLTALHGSMGEVGPRVAANLQVRAECALERGDARRSNEDEMLALRVPVAPVPVPVRGAVYLSYELHVTNTTADSVALRTLEILDGRANAMIVQGDSLEARLGPSGVGSQGQRRTIAPMQWAVIYLEVPFEGVDAPTSLMNRLSHVNLRTKANGQTTLTVEVSRTTPVVLGPPLAGGPWAAIYNPSWERGHRRVYYTVDGCARLPGRYAIDFMKLDDAGRLTLGDQDRVSTWLGYGADVLAVADATVAATRDGMAEATLVSVNTKHAPTDAAGNYIVLDLGNGRFAFYEHLKPGSVRVHVGDRVRRGDVIGALGYTGDSTGPHLHFHVGDAASPLGAEGVPYVFDAFELLGAFSSLDSFGKVPWASASPSEQHRKNELPSPSAVVRF